MNKEEFRNEMLENLAIETEYNSSDMQGEFVKYVIQTLIEAEEFEDFTEGYFEGIGERNKKLMMDGYYFDLYDKSFVIMLTDFSGKEINENLISTEINKLYDYMRNLVESCLSGYISNKGFEESSPGYGMSKVLEEKIKEIVKFRFYIATDKTLSNRVKNIKKENIMGKSVELNVWDINRFLSIYNSSLGKESIEIDFNSNKSKGLSCVSATVEESYSAYLAVIPGDVLANMYIEYGSRLLEGNVRSFLSIKGKVNKGIRNTILNEPSMFFAYNNGIAATASEVMIEKSNEGIFISKIKDLQIINGGQTTASIANAVLQDNKDVSNIFVPMKLSVVEHDKATIMIPTISRCANSQNKVDEADFFSNHPYHIRIEEYSRKILAPPTGGNQYQTVWFYERARGQYVQEQMKLSTSERKKYQLKNPKQQLIKKVDLAKYINTFSCIPYIVSKGAQASMRHFAEKIDKEWNKSNEKYNEHYFKKIISYAIIFKETESLIANQEWYKKIKAYRANTVTYSIAVIMNEIKQNYPTKNLDFKKIWNNQTCYNELQAQLLITTKEVFDFINQDDRLTLNVTEWCKKEICWERAQKANFTFTKEFIESLTDIYEEKIEEKSSKEERKLENKIEAEIEVINLGEDYWKKIYIWAIERKLLSAMEESLLKLASNFLSTGRIPSSKQCNIIIDIRERLYSEGLPK